MQDDNRRTLWKIYKTYYKLGIHHFIGNSGHAIFTGLLYKFNELGFPDELKISIQEMFSLSAISDIRTLRNARNKLSAYLHEESNPDSWIARYHDNGIKEYGTYEINFVFLQEYYCNFTEELQENSSKKYGLSAKIDTDLSPKSAKNVLPSNTILYETKLEKKEEVQVSNSKIIHDSDDKQEPPPPTISDSDREYFNKARKAIEFHFDTHYFTSRKGMMPAKRAMMIEIGKYPDNVIKNAIELAGMGLKNPEYLIPNLLEKLRNNGNGHKPQADVDPVKAEIKAKASGLRKRIETCQDGDTFWRLLKQRMSVGDQKAIDLWDGYEKERIKFDAKLTYEQFIEGVKE